MADLKSLTDTKALLDDVQDFLNDPNFQPQAQNKWFFADGMSYYKQLCEVVKLLTYLQEAFVIVGNNEQTLKEVTEDLQSKVNDFDTKLGNLPQDVQTLQEQVQTLTTNVAEQLSKIETLQDNITTINSKDEAQDIRIDGLATDVTDIKAKDAEQDSDLLGIHADIEAVELNVAKNASDITKLNEADYLKEVILENSSTVTFTGGLKEDGTQTYTAQVTGSIPANLTENLAFANNNTTPVVYGVSSADVIIQDTYIANAISLQSINNGKSNNATIPVSKFNSAQFEKNATNVVSLKADLLAPYETKENANATYETKENATATYETKENATATYETKANVSATYAKKTDVNTALASKQDNLTFDTQWFTETDNTVSLNDSVFDDYLTKDDAPGYADILTSTDASSTYLSKTVASSDYATKAYVDTAIGTAINADY